MRGALYFLALASTLLQHPLSSPKAAPAWLWCRPLADGLHLLMDRRGIKFLGEGEWKREKHCAEYRRAW